jgi:hypothetical protein
LRSLDAVFALRTGAAVTPAAMVAAHLPEVLASIERSTLAEPLRSALGEFVDLHVHAAAGRAESASAARVARSRRIRAAIDLANNALPTSLAPGDRVALVHTRLHRVPRLYGLAAGPSERTVRRVLFGTRPTSGATYDTTTSSST